MCAGALEKAPLGTHQKCKFVVSVRLDFANLSDQVNNSTPTQIARQFAAGKTFKKFFMVFTNALIHPMSISSAGQQ